jgi:hypothetical protein
MRSARAILFVSMAASLMLAACGSAVTAAPSPSSTPALPTDTHSPSPTYTRISSPTRTSVPTSTATLIACDPSSAVYCIEDAYLVFLRPILPPGTDSIDRGYPYGSTEGGTRDPHHGVEFSNPSGTPVQAAAGGMVYYAGDDTTRKFSPWSGFYGNIVVLEHPLSGAPFDRLYTLYAHLSKMDVSRGQTVTAGEKIGEVGLSGTASGSHLHFEVRVDPNDYDSTLNPELWLIPHPGDGTMAFQFLDHSGISIHPLLIQVQYFLDPTSPSAADYFPEVYSFEPPILTSPFQEIAALSDLPGGRYRITFMWAGVLNEKWVEIQPGKLTRVMFVVK